jgi:hypothetical protein
MAGSLVSRLFVCAVRTQAAGLGVVLRELEAGHIILGDRSRTVGMRQRCRARIPCVVIVGSPTRKG